MPASREMWVKSCGLSAARGPGCRRGFSLVALCAVRRAGRMCGWHVQKAQCALPACCQMTKLAEQGSACTVKRLCVLGLPLSHQLPLTLSSIYFFFLCPQFPLGPFNSQPTKALQINQRDVVSVGRRSAQDGLEDHSELARTCISNTHWPISLQRRVLSTLHTSDTWPSSSSPHAHARLPAPSRLRNKA